MNHDQRLALAVGGAGGAEAHTEGTGSHIVRSGDTVHSVAKRYGVDPDDIRVANGIIDDQLYVGARLVIDADAAPSHSSARARGGTYEVQPGDALIRIARRHGVSVAALQAANSISGSAIRPGQTLAIPGGAGIAASTTATPSGRQTLYTVQTGDTQRRIAARHGISVEELQRWNGLQPEDPVKLGQRLSIWTRATAPAAVATAGSNQKVGYRVKSGDSLYAIASRYKVAVNDIMRWNQMSSHNLQAGQRLTLYVP